jgi:hypothetical protein
VGKLIRINRIILLLAIMLIANALDTPVSAKEMFVDSSTGDAFKPIQEAVNNSSSEDEILVYSGFYNESVEIGVQNMQILEKSEYPEVRDFTVNVDDVVIMI